VKWCALNNYLVPYGGLLAAEFQARETLLVSGATGNFGSAAVAVALAMGAGKVVAPGRNENVLESLRQRYGNRVITVKLTGGEAEDRKAMMRMANGPIDCVLDLMPPSVSANIVRAAMMTVRPFGRIILMGGVGMLGGEGMTLDYSWIMRNWITIKGQWMYPTKAVAQIINLVHSGLLSLDDFEFKKFSLDDANEAVEHAARDQGRFKMTVICPISPRN